jgi:hypothetical protein
VGELREALAVLLKAAELGPNSKMTHYQLAQVYARLKDDDKRKLHLEIFDRLSKEEKEQELKKSENIRREEKREKVETETAPVPGKN